MLADTEQLHRKIAEMGQRIRQLEDALTIFQSGVSSETHPLLRDELLAVKFGPEVRTGQNSQNTEMDPPADQAVTDTMDALGTLSIGDGGASKYFGRSAGSEVSILLDRCSCPNDNTSVLFYKQDTSTGKIGRHNAMCLLNCGILTRQVRSWMVTTSRKKNPSRVSFQKN